MSLYPSASFGAKPSLRMGFFVLLLLLGSLTACLKDTSWGNYPLPEATRIGANKVGFKLGQTVLIPAGLNRTNLTADVGKSRLYIAFSCVNDRMNLKHFFQLEVNDSLYEGATFKAKNGCSWGQQLPEGSMCTRLNDNVKNKQYLGSNPHDFSLHITHFERILTSTRMVLGNQGDSVLQRTYKLICAGTFSGVLITIAGEQVSINDGRFDLQSSKTEQ